jgi:hypothetical protein
MSVVLHGSPLGVTVTIGKRVSLWVLPMIDAKPPSRENDMRSTTTYLVVMVSETLLDTLMVRKGYNFM